MTADTPQRLGEFEVIDTVAETAVGAMYRAHRGRRSYVRVLASVYICDEEAIGLALSDGYRFPFSPHPNLGGGCMYVDSLARGRAGASVFFACSPANDLDLETLVRERGPLPWAEARRMLLDVCCGLDEAHRWAVVHGDLQAGHCFLLEREDGEPADPRVRVTGFGLAAARRRGLAAGHEPPPWMPPEQVAGRAPDERSDVYAAGCLLLHLLLGRLPSSRDAALVYRRETLNFNNEGDRAEPPRWPREVDRLLDRALAPDPDARFPTIRELAAALAGVDDGDVAAAMARFERPAPHRSLVRDLSEPMQMAVGAALAIGVLALLWLVVWLVFVR